MDTNSKLEYPKCVFFILFYQLCRSFGVQSARSVSPIYLTEYLQFDERTTTIIFHSIYALAFIASIFGAVMCDSFVGKFKSVLYLTSLAATGGIILLLGSTPLSLPRAELSLIGLYVMIFGAGAATPCVLSLGGDQFVLPQQKEQLTSFFSFVHFFAHIGYIFAGLAAPLLRKYVRCFDEDTCYPLVFGVLEVLVVTGIILLWVGKPFYKKTPVESSLIVKVIACMWNAIKTRNHKQHSHWLDSSIEKYGKKLVDDIKSMLKSLIIFTPFPVFFALYDQTGSAWIFQASRMDGKLGSYTILPDQWFLVDSVLHTLFVPIVRFGMYPIMNKCSLLKRPLPKIICGGIILLISYVISACVALRLEENTKQFSVSGENDRIMYERNTAHLNTATFSERADQIGKLSMLWLIPQFVLSNLGTVMFIISGMEFSYSQAPSTMKTVVMAFWMLTNSFGNMLVMMIEAIKIFELQSRTLFFYSGIMTVDLGLFALLTLKYRYNDQ